MLSDATLSALLLQVYGCALRRGDWPALLAHVCTFVGMPQAALVHHRVVDGQFIAASESNGVDPEAMAKYNQYYGRLDPWTKAYQQRGGFKRGSGSVITSDELMPHAAFQRTEFFGDFGARFGMVRNVMVCGVAEDGESATALTFPTPAGGPEHPPEMLAALRLLAPHLQQALVLGHAIAGAQRRIAELTAAIDAASEPMALLAPDGSLIVLNAAMQALTLPGQPLFIDKKRLACRAPRTDTALRAALRGFSQWQHGLHAVVAPSIILAADGRSRSLTLTLSPLPALAGSPPFFVVVRVLDQAAATERRVARKVAAWGLTPAEERMTRLLASGKTVADIAAATSTRQATVRWHLRQVFSKTSTRTQAQLVALLYS